VAGRFKLLTDEHWSKAHIRAARDAGWEVARLIDVPELGRGTPDPQILAHCSRHGYVWVTTDEHAKGDITDWLRSGGTLPGVIVVIQRHRVGPGRLVRLLEKLAAEEAPFAGTLRFVKPEHQ
jgi:hypothetical protein